MRMKQNNKSINYQQLKGLFTFFKINPKNYSNYIQALTHSSYAHENGLNYNYERYEFIGDAAISWIISNFLFDQIELNEGLMSIKKAKLISGKTLALAAKKINLDKIILVGKGLESISDKILENVFEAFIGAVAKDVGIKKAYSIIDYCIIQPYLNGEIQTEKPYKTLIQEALMRSYNKEIKYVRDNQLTPSNFVNKYPIVVNLIFDGQVYGVGSGKTLKEAEENAAKNAYSKLTTKK